MIRKNQKGFTLVELIIAVAILAIVTLAVCGFIVVGSKSYTSANTDIMLQQEAQLALNQISDVIIDTTDSITYSVGTSGGMQNVLKDSEYGGDATDKCLAVVNRNDTGSNNDNPSYWFYWNKDDEKIYFNEVPVDSTMDPGDIQAAFKSLSDDPNNQPVLAEHVTDISIDISQFEENRVVMISMTLQNGNREYSTSNNVTVRNKVALNVVDISPMKRADRFLIADVPPVTLEPGEEYTFTASVDTASSDTALKWSLESGPQNGTWIDEESGKLTVGIGEIRTNFNVIVSRMNEEYAGQNDRVSKRVQVNVKRVTFVSDYDVPGAPGETVVLNSSIDGNMLGKDCDGFGCDGKGEDYILDENSWDITSGQELVTSITGDTEKATVQISPTAKGGDVIVVTAASKRSKTKHYGPLDNPTVEPVTGVWRIKIEKKDVDTVAMPGSFRFNEDNDDILSWLKQGITMGSASEYLVYARVKDPTGRMADRVAIYYTNVGENIRFYPDMFGLELDRSYQLFLQAILPVHKDKIAEEKIKAPGNSDYSGYVHDYDDVIVDYILSHLDPSSGKYIGTDYDAGFYYEGMINPPVISIKYNNHSYPGSDKDYSENYSVFSTQDTVIGSIYLNHDGVMNIEAKSSLNGQIYFGIYKGEGSDINNWKLVAGYDPSIGDLGGYLTNSGESFKNTEMFYLQIQSSGSDLLTNDNYFKRRTNISDLSAAGTYHIVPGFIYANKEQLPTRNYIFLYRSYEDVADFNDHFYLQPDCAITLKVDASMNMNLVYGGKQQGWISFPLPTEAPFTWYPGAEWEQTFWGNYDIYTAKNAGEKTGTTLSNPTVKCKYDSSTGTYRIQLKKEEWGNKGTVISDYGTYEWSPGDTEWTTYKPGDGVVMGDNSTWGPLIYFTYQGQEWMMEMPLPTDSNWPFQGGNNSTSQTINYYQTDDLTAWYGRNAYFEIKWDNTTETLTLSFGNGGSFIGKWKLSSDKKSWIAVTN